METDRGFYQLHIDEGRKHPKDGAEASAEYEAALAGLAEVKARGIAYIAVFTDSRNLVNQLSGRFASSGHLAEYMAKLRGHHR